MDRSRSDDEVARVVAWHNRHPLAHHIEPEQVVSHGHVELPFRSLPGQPRAAWRAVFSERFLPGFSPRRVARWALKHGESVLQAQGSGKLRQLQIDTPKARDEGQAELLWLRTAAVVFGGRQTRVLLSSTDARAVLGRRLFSRPRQAFVTVLLALGVALPVLRHARHDGDDEPEPPPVVAAVAPAPSAEAPPLQLEPPAEAAAAEAPPRAASRPLPPPPTPLPARPPFEEAQVRRGTVEMPRLKPQLAEAARAAAREAGLPLREPPAAAPTFALVLRRVRTQAESELMGDALKSLLARTGARPGLRVDAMPAGDDWRVVCWPFASRDEAERLRQQLPAGGQAVEVIVF